MAPTQNAVGGDDDSGRPAKGKLPAFPGQDALLHDAQKWREERDDLLTSLKLLDVARGGEPLGLDKFQDFPLDLMPEPAPGSAHEHKMRIVCFPTVASAVY